METILLLISVAIFLSYIGFIALKYGIQKSISESYYRLPSKQKVLFTLALWGFAIPVIILGGMLESWLLFLAGGLITLVGAAPAFKSLLMEYKAHMFGAYGGILLGLTALVVNFNLWWLVLIAVILAVIIKFTIKNYIWWIEVLAFFTVLLGIYLS